MDPKTEIPVHQDLSAEDEVLVAALQAGDTEALGKLFVRRAPEVRRLLLSVMGPNAELDDLVQDVFLKVHRSIGKFRKEARFSTWLHQITVYTAISSLRKPRRLVSLPDSAAETLEGGAATPENAAVSRERINRLFALLETLSVKRRVAFTLFTIDGLPLRETAKILGVPETVAKSRIFFARRELFKKAASDPYLAPLLEEWNP